MRKETIGDSTLYLGDSAEILSTLRDEDIDILITDPPYCSGGFQESGKSSGSIGTRGKQTISMDNLSTRGYQRLMQRTFRGLLQVEEFYCFTDWKMWINLFDAMEDGGIRVRNMLVWDKKQMGMGMPWRNQHELIAYGKRGAGEIRTGKHSNVIPMKRSGNKNHPTEKPVDLMAHLIRNSMEGSIIDPFMGSGSTGVAATKEGRKFIGIEIDETHFETSCKRIEEAQKQLRLF